MYPTQSGFVLRHMRRSRQGVPELVLTVISMGEMYNQARIYIEDAASGQSLIQSLKNDTRLLITPVKVATDRVSRANAVTVQVEAGNVLLPSGAPSLGGLMYKLTDFPGATHHD